MLARHCKGRVLKDEVFATAQRAKKAQEAYGAEAVVNATLGALYDEEERLLVFDVVEELQKTLEIREFTAYAPHFTGSDSYKAAVKTSIFGRNPEEEGFFTSVVATPGGTGAISTTLYNYMNAGEKLLVPEKMWGPYKLIAKGAGGSHETYPLFKEDGSFAIEAFAEKVARLSKEQESLVIIINDPCQNPTGMRLTEAEWKSVMEILKGASKDTDVVLLKDIAYRDMEADLLDDLKLLEGMPKNFLCLYAFSLSKALGIYGMRTGAVLAISKEKEVVEEFEKAAFYFCRSLWSNAPRGGMSIFSAIMEDEDLRNRWEKEKADCRDLLGRRAKVFMEEAKACGLKLHPYQSGFFITLPVGKEIAAVMQRLEEKERIFAIPFGEDLRIAICSIPLRKLKGLAEKIKHNI